MKSSKTVIFMRKRRPEASSIEEIFYPLLPYLGKNVKIIELPHSSGSIFNILRNIIFAAKHQGAINHISGEIHYLSIGLGKKSVLTIHDVDTILKLQGGGKLSNFIKKILWFTLPCRMAGLITCISDSTKEDVKDKFAVKDDKIRVIHNPINQMIINLEGDSSSNPNMQGTNIILHVGTPPHKNLERVIPICKELNIKLMVLGKMSTSQRELAKSMDLNYEEYNNIDFSEVINLYRKATFVSFPSMYEGFGMPIIEANAIGVPIIAGDIPVLHEVADDAALFVNPHNKDDIKRAFEKLLNDSSLRLDLINRGKRNAKRFTPEAIGLEYQKAYKDLKSL